MDARSFAEDFSPALESERFADGFVRQKRAREKATARLSITALLDHADKAAFQAWLKDDLKHASEPFDFTPPGEGRGGQGEDRGRARAPAPCPRPGRPVWAATMTLPGAALMALADQLLRSDAPAPLILARFEHASLAAPFRLVRDNADLEHAGETYKAAWFGFQAMVSRAGETAARRRRAGAAERRACGLARPHRRRPRRDRDLPSGRARRAGRRARRAGAAGDSTTCPSARPRSGFPFAGRTSISLRCLIRHSPANTPGLFE